MPIASMPQVIASPFAREFEDVFEEHYSLVYRTAYGITGRVEDAEDVVQTVFLRLLQRGTPPELLKNPAGYLYRAAVNVALTTVQSRQRRAVKEDGEAALALVPTPQPSRAEETHRQLY